MKKRIIFTIILALTFILGAFALTIGASVEEDTQTLEINGANVSFDESVHLLFSVGYKNVASPENIKLLVWRDAEGIHVDNLTKGTEDYVLDPMKNAPEGLAADSIAFKFTDIAAAEMTENFYVRAYYVENGEEILSSPKKYSVLRYAMNKLGITGTESEDELLKNMLTSMLTYGADAQRYFGVNLDRLATDSYVNIKLSGATFDDGTSTSLVRVGDSVTLRANVTEELPHALWTNGADELISSDSVYTFTASKNESITLTLLAHVHTFASEWSYDNESHWHESTCGHDVRSGEAEHFIGADGGCVSNCGYYGETPHTHTYSAEWSMDEIKHWREATCEHTDLVVESGDHTYGDDGKCTSCGFNRVLTITLSDIEQGGWGYGKKNGVSLQRIRVERLIPVKAGTVINYSLGSMELFLDLADGIDSSTGTRIGWKKGTGSLLIDVDCYLGITLAAEGRSTAVSPSDFDGVSISLTLGGSDGERALEKLNVYKFGGEGNDWCFVYLPDGYDPKREEPYPFVIANHGNGWIMNGSYQMANWTNISQYLPASEITLKPENIRSRFIATDDPTLWYSNPTIEALLDAGYIVAGAQNYGDGLYGNDNCTDACVAFFNHMVSTYNVEDSCYMIGASNGAMTTLGAAAKLGERVKSIILQYPLTSIISQYVSGNHQDAIEKAYGLDTSKTYTKAELEALISEYDPLYKNVENGVKLGYFPSVKIYYSMTDTTTPAESNALPLIAMLDKSGIEYEGVRIDEDGSSRQHGHADHFDPEGSVLWFDNH